MVAFIDVDDIKFVINYDFPQSSEDYVHRIGRTGRRDRKGTAYTFFTQQNAKYAPDLVKILAEAGQYVDPALTEMAQLSQFYRPRSAYTGIWSDWRPAKNGQCFRPLPRQGGGVQRIRRQAAELAQALQRRRERLRRQETALRRLDPARRWRQQLRRLRWQERRG